MSTPHRCPVCDGKGLVPNGFYQSVGVYGWNSSSITPEKCRSCDGTGIVWSGGSMPLFPTPFPLYIQPLPPSVPPPPGWPEITCTQDSNTRIDNTKESNDNTGREDK